MAYHLTHPNSPDHEIEVAADQVPMYASQGWETKPGAKPADEVAPEKPAKGK